MRMQVRHIQAIETGAARLKAQHMQSENGAIAEILFSHVARHNAVDLEAWQAIPALMSKLVSELSDTPDTRLIILRGDGGKAFIAGADISQFDAVFTGPEDNQSPKTRTPNKPEDNQQGNRSRRTQSEGSQSRGNQYDRATIAAFDSIVDCPVPTLAAIKGHCIGGGLGIALACDIRLARADSRFGIPSGRLGLAYPANATARLVETVGKAFAKEIIFTGRHFNADEALAMGLINRQVSRDAFESTVDTLTAQICANAPMSLQTSKYLVEKNDAKPETVNKKLAACLTSADYAEGRRAFLEKRKPVFRGQ